MERTLSERMADDEPVPVIFRARDRQCLTCRHLDPGWVMATTCAAFPNGIPTPILTNRFDHRRPWNGDGTWPSDNGIQYEEA